MASDYVFTYLAAATGGAGGYVDSSWRIVLHTTETNSKPSLWIPNFKYPSHVVCSYEHNEVFQLVGFNEAGKALYKAPGGVETNRMGAIQIEINGYADEAGNWSQEKLKWLGEEVLKPICDWIDENGGGFDCYNIPAPGAHGGSASEDAPQRMSYSEWTNFNGICGHRHVPDNDHYDPDQLNVPAIVDYANSVESEMMSDSQYNALNARLDILQQEIEAIVWTLGNIYKPATADPNTTVSARLNRIGAVVERFNTDAYVRSTGTDPKNPGNSLNIFDHIWRIEEKKAAS